MTMSSNLQILFSANVIMTHSEVYTYRLYNSSRFRAHGVKIHKVWSKRENSGVKMLIQSEKLLVWTASSEV